MLCIVFLYVLNLLCTQDVIESTMSDLYIIASSVFSLSHGGTDVKSQLDLPVLGILFLPVVKTYGFISTLVT